MATTRKIGDAAPPNWKERRLFTAHWHDNDWSVADLPAAPDLWNRSDLFHDANARAIALRDMTLENCDVQLIGTTTDGPEPRMVPFPHIAFLSPMPPRKFGLENRLESQMRRSWGLAYVDPYKDCRVHFFLEPGQYGPRAMWGDGIFIPGDGQQPQGDVQVAPWLTEDRTWGNWRSLSFAEPASPAGLFRGQSGLVFSNTPGMTLAVDRRIGSPPLLAYLGTSRLKEGPIALMPVDEDGITDATATTKSWDARHPDTEPGWDDCFRVWRDETPSFQLRYTLDRRKSRLHRTPPPANGFAIIGILAPRQAGLARWWINLDKDDRLIASAMLNPHVTLVCAGNKVERHIWATGRRRAAAERLDDEVIGGETRQVLRFTKPAGYLEVLPNLATASFTADGSPDRFQLDWLDFAGAAERLIGDRRTGLAALWDTEPVQRLTTSPVRLLVGPLLLEALSKG